MECGTRFNRRCWLQKWAISLCFGLFTVSAQALGLFGPPSITVQPIGISVQNGGTAVITCTITSVDGISGWDWWYKTNGSSKLVPATNCTTLNLPVGQESIMTIPNVSSANAGTYYLTVANSYGTTTSSNVTIVVLLDPIANVLSGVSGASKMLTNGFKVQFSAPTGSNIVIQAATSLNNWSSIYTNVASSGSITYTDAVAKTCSCRFYRAYIK